MMMVNQPSHRNQSLVRSKIQHTLNQKPNDVRGDISAAHIIKD